MVRMRTRVASPLATISFVAAVPSISAIERSMTTTSGLNRSTRAIASRPSLASPITSMSRAVPRTALRPARTTAWSPARTTRIRSLDMVGCRVEWYLDEHAGSRARLAADLDPASHQPSALAHRDHAHAGAPPLRIGDVEAAAIVADGHARHAVDGADLDLDVLRSGVPERVRDGLLRHAIEHRRARL